MSTSSSAAARNARPSQSASSNAMNYEPDDAWKARLQQQIEMSMQVMMDDAHKEYEKQVASATSPEHRQHIDREYSETVENLKSLAKEQFMVELVREREERKWLANNTQANGLTDVLKKEQEDIWAQIERKQKTGVSESPVDDRIPQSFRPGPTDPPPKSPPPQPQSAASFSQILDPPQIDPSPMIPRVIPDTRPSTSASNRRGSDAQSQTRGAPYDHEDHASSLRRSKTSMANPSRPPIPSNFQPVDISEHRDPQLARSQLSQSRSSWSASERGSSSASTSRPADRPPNAATSASPISSSAEILQRHLARSPPTNAGGLSTSPHVPQVWKPSVTPDDEQGVGIRPQATQSIGRRSSQASMRSMASTSSAKSTASRSSLSRQPPSGISADTIPEREGGETEDHGEEVQERIRANEEHIRKERQRQLETEQSWQIRDRQRQESGGDLGDVYVSRFGGHTPYHDADGQDGGNGELYDRSRPNGSLSPLPGDPYPRLSSTGSINRGDPDSERSKQSNTMKTALSIPGTDTVDSYSSPMRKSTSSVSRKTSFVEPHEMLSSTPAPPGFLSPQTTGGSTAKRRKDKKVTSAHVATLLGREHLSTAPTGLLTPPTSAGRMSDHDDFPPQTNGHTHMPMMFEEAMDEDYGRIERNASTRRRNEPDYGPIPRSDTSEMESLSRRPGSLNTKSKRAKDVPPLSAYPRYGPDPSYQTQAYYEQHSLQTAPPGGSFPKRPRDDGHGRKVRMSQDNPTVWGAPSDPIPMPPKSAGILRSNSQSKHLPSTATGLAPPPSFAPSRSPRGQKAWDPYAPHPRFEPPRHETSEESTSDGSGEADEDHDDDSGKTSDDSSYEVEPPPPPFRPPNTPAEYSNDLHRSKSAAGRRDSNGHPRRMEPAYPAPPPMSRPRNDYARYDASPIKRTPSNPYHTADPTDDSTDNDDRDDGPMRYEEIQPMPTTRNEPPPRSADISRSAFGSRSSSRPQSVRPPELYPEPSYHQDGLWERSKNNSSSSRDSAKQQRERERERERERDRDRERDRERVERAERERADRERLERERAERERRELAERERELELERERKAELERERKRAELERERERERAELLERERERDRLERERIEMKRREQDQILAKLEREMKERERELQLHKEKLERERAEREKAEAAEKVLRDRMEFERQEHERAQREKEEELRKEKEKRAKEQHEAQEKEELMRALKEAHEERMRREKEQERMKEEQERKNKENEMLLQQLHEAKMKAEEALRVAQLSAQQSANSKKIAQAEADELKKRVEDAHRIAREAAEKHFSAYQLQQRLKEKEAEAKQKELDILRKEKELQERELKLQRQEEQLKQQEALNRLEALLTIKEEETRRLMDTLELQRRELDRRDQELKTIQRAQPTIDFVQPNANDETEPLEIASTVEPETSTPFIPPAEAELEPEPVVEVKAPKVKEKKAKGKKRAEREKREAEERERLREREHKERQEEEERERKRQENEEKERREREEQERLDRLEAERLEEEERRLYHEEIARRERELERQAERRQEERLQREAEEKEILRIAEEERKKREAMERESRERVLAERRRREESERHAEQVRRMREEEVRRQEQERQERLRKEQEDAATLAERKFREEQEAQHRNALEMERQRKQREEELANRRRQEEAQRARFEEEERIKLAQQEEFRQREEEIRRRADRKRQDSFGNGTWQDINFNAPYGTPPPHSSSTPKPPPPRSGSGSFGSSNGPPPAWTTWSNANAGIPRSSTTIPTSSSTPSPSKPRAASGASGASSQYSSQVPLSEADWARKQAEWTRIQQEKFRQEQERLEAMRQARMAGAPTSRENLSALYERNEKMWSLLPSKDVLRWTDFPWPVVRPAHTPEDITTFGIESYICSQHYPDKSRSEKDRIKEYIKRWHPDRFETKLLVKVSEDEKEKVREGAGSVVRSLNDLLSKRNDANDWL